MQSRVDEPAEGGAEEWECTGCTCSSVLGRRLEPGLELQCLEAYLKSNGAKSGEELSGHGSLASIGGPPSAGVTLTSLTLRVLHLRLARHSFVVHQRRAERRLVLQLLGSRLDGRLVRKGQGGLVSSLHGYISLTFHLHECKPSCC